MPAVLGDLDVEEIVDHAVVESRDRTIHDLEIP